MVLSVLWLTLVYCPVTHWVWGSGGWLAKLGTLDFAGGIVVHINAGASALALAMILGPRKAYKDRVNTEPNNIPMVALGAGLLWFGWFGFNAGSALSSGQLATSAFVVTNAAGAAAAFTWMLLGWLHRRPSLLGVVTGGVVGLAAVTPASGYISPMAGILIGIVAACLSYYAMLFRAKKIAIDETLDVTACHGIGGTWGTLAAGLFASTLINPAGANGLFNGNAVQVLKQLAGIGAVWVFAFAATWVLAKIVDATIGIRVSSVEENVGLDISQHGERAYGGSLR